jgi:hypothetical protein
MCDFLMKEMHFSQQVVMAVIGSPRPVHLRGTPRTMASALDTILEEVEAGRMSIFRRHLNVRELGLRVGVLAMHLN